MDCRTPVIQSAVGGSGAPGGLLPAGGDQWDFLQFNGTLWVPSWVMPETVTAPEAGEVLTSINGVGEFQTPLGDLLQYRNSASTLTVANTWLAQWFSPNAFATMNLAGFAVALRTGVLRWLRVFHSTALLISEVLTYTVVVNGVDTALSTSLNVNATGPASNLTTTVAVTEGDLISVRVAGAGGSRAVRLSVDFFLD
jgi:hypothetical protein